MSYRSIKRVLGETSLERKCRLLFGACLLLLITTSFWLYSFQTEWIVNDQNRNTGRLLVDQEMAVRHWKGFETAEKYQDLAKKLAELFGKQKYNVRFILPNRPMAKNGGPDGSSPRDDFELEAIQRFLKNEARKSPAIAAADYKERTSEDGDTYHYYQPIRAESDECLICHQPLGSATGEPNTNFGRAVVANSAAEAKGDLMAVAELTFSTEKTRQAIIVNRMILLAMAIITVFLAMVASYVIVRYVIVKPLRHLRDVSDAISRGNIALRADIHTGDEFEELAVAFNRMLRHLTDVQEEIRQVNASLDGKVDELAQANMRLYELNMLKSDFLATMSHELRTPLNSILGFSEVLGSIDALDDKQKRYVQNIQKSGKTLLEMINDILDLAKIESGKMETRLTDFRIAQVVTAQADMARPLTERKNIDLETHVDARAAAHAPGPGPGAASAQQPVVQRHQVHARRRTHHHFRRPRRVELPGAEGERYGRGHRRGGSAGDFREVPPGADRRAQRRRHDPRILRQRAGAFDRQGAVPAARAARSRSTASWAKGAPSRSACRGSSQDQPRLDSALVEGIEEFTKQRFEVGASVPRRQRRRNSSGG